MYQNCVQWELLGCISVDSRHSSFAFLSHPHPQLPHEEFGYHVVLFGEMLLQSLLGMEEVNSPSQEP